MSIIEPFRGIRYDTTQAGELAELIAPPYDVISAEMRSRLEQRSAHNVIKLILPEDKKGDTERKNKYTRAAVLWRKWNEEGVLRRDPTPRIYRYQMSFQVKTPDGIITRERPGFIALLKLHEYREGKVLPHERTLAGPKQDRFQLMLHTRAQLSQIFMLYPDPEGVTEDLLGNSPPSDAEAFGCEDDQGVTHTLWPVDDLETIRAVNRHLGKNPVYIADGHHRYETSLSFRKYMLDTSPLFAHGCDYVMAYFTPAEHEGLTIFPYHRLVHNLPKRRMSGLLKKLDQVFNVDRVLLSPLPPGSPRREFMHNLVEKDKGGTVFGMVDGTSGQAHYLELKPDSALFRSCKSEQEMMLCGLDVVILEDLILAGMLGMKPKDLLNEKYITYETDYDRVIDLVQKPPNQLVFLLNPTPIGEVIKVADMKGIMPEKSTYFFPKVATGLVMNAID